MTGIEYLLPTKKNSFAFVALKFDD